MFKEERNASKFDWRMLGNVDEGRPNLGDTTSVYVYRLMQFTLRDVMIQELGVEKTDKIFYKAGEHAGQDLYKNIVTKKDSFSAFISNLQEILKDLAIGILRVENADIDRSEFTLTIAEDLDCSGLPVTNEEICTYDEGFIAGVFSEYFGKSLSVKEVDCWCSGDRVCRFSVEPMS